MDSDPIFEVIGAQSATSNVDGTYVHVALEMRGDRLNLAIPAGQLAPIIALLSQAAGQAEAIAGTATHQRILETVDTEVHRDQENVDVHFRLNGGLDLPIGMPIRVASALRDKLSASLEPGLSFQSPTRQ